MGDTTGPQRKHVEVLHSLRDRRYKALKEALELRQAGVRGTQAAGLRDLCRGLLSEIRALDAALAHLLVADTQELLVQTVQFYGDPESYMAIGFFPDRPCGDFIEDFEDTELGLKPGKRARATLAALDEKFEKVRKR
jgi:hypothetical protein